MKSIWMKDKKKKYDKLNQNISCDVLIVGGGLSGLLSAYQLKEHAERLVLIESDEIASGATGRNTGKVTFQHGLELQKIFHYHGEDKTRLYYEENEKAIHALYHIMEKEQIECDWQIKTALVGCKSEEYEKNVDKEIEVYNTLQIPYERIENETCHKGIQVHQQASFDPYAFCLQLAEKMEIEIYEHTPMISIQNHEVSTGAYKIKYKTCILATQVMPFQFKPFYALMHPKQTFLAALSPSEHSNEMILLEDEITKTRNDTHDFMLVGGYDHSTMEEATPLWQKFRRDLVLEYPQHQILECWSSQDYECVDGLPLVDSNDDFIFITGFNKWGNTNAMVSSTIVKDIYEDKNTERRALYSIHRASLYLNVNIFGENYEVMKSLVKSKMKADHSNLPEDQKAIQFEINRHPYGIYRQGDTFYIVDALCPHLGCTLRFNEIEKCWDCPCHGSRFSIEGKIIKGPALEPLHFGKCTVDEMKWKRNKNMLK